MQYLLAPQVSRPYIDGESVEEFEYALKWWFKYMYRDFNYAELTELLFGELDELREAWQEVRKYPFDAELKMKDGEPYFDATLNYSLELADVFNYIMSIGIHLGINSADAIRSVSKFDYAKRLGKGKWEAIRNSADWFLVRYLIAKNRPVAMINSDPTIELGDPHLD
mgnify:CR=1 FL=1